MPNLQVSAIECAAPPLPQEEPEQEEQGGEVEVEEEGQVQQGNDGEQQGEEQGEAEVEE